MSRPSALITGASSGIGKSFAFALARTGFDIIAVARRADRLKDLRIGLDEYGGTTTPIVADLARPEDRNRLANRIRARDIEFVANVAGFGGYGSFDGLPFETFEHLLAVHIHAVAELTHAAVSRCPARTSVVNVSSLLALSGGLPPGPLPARAIYAGAKSFILTFTETLAAETISGLRLQALLPGMVATEFGGGYSGETSMSADDVVRASLIALDRGEIVCVPGLDDDTALERLRAARLGVMSGGTRRELSSRYHVAT